MNRLDPDTTTTSLNEIPHSLSTALRASCTTFFIISIHYRGEQRTEPELRVELTVDISRTFVCSSPDDAFKLTVLHV